jgi:hypothetical protein
MGDDREKRPVSAGSMPRKPGIRRLLLFWAGYILGFVGIGLIARNPDWEGFAPHYAALAALVLTVAVGVLLCATQRLPPRGSWMAGLILGFAWVPLAVLLVFVFG